MDSYGRAGYNATLGGDGSILFDYDLIAKTYETGLTCKETAMRIGCCVQTVRDVLKIKGIDSYKNHKKNVSKVIDQLDLDGNYLRTFPSASDAGRWLVSEGIVKEY